MQSTNLDEVVPMKTDCFLTLRRAKSVLNHKHGKILHALSRWKKRTMMMRFHLIVHARQACSCGKTYQLRLLIISLRVPKSSYFQWKSCTGYRFKLWRTRMEIICQRHQYVIRVVQLNPRQPNGLSPWEGYSDCGRSRCWSSFFERGNIRKIYI